MALWGTRDSFAITGTISVANNSTTVTGNASAIFTTELDIGNALVINGYGKRISSNNYWSRYTRVCDDI